MRYTIVNTPAGIPVLLKKIPAQYEKKSHIASSKNNYLPPPPITSTTRRSKKYKKHKVTVWKLQSVVELWLKIIMKLYITLVILVLVVLVEGQRGGGYRGVRRGRPRHRDRLRQLCGSALTDICTSAAVPGEWKMMPQINEASCPAAGDVLTRPTTRPDRTKPCSVSTVDFVSHNATTVFHTGTEAPHLVFDHSTRLQSNAQNVNS